MTAPVRRTTQPGAVGENRERIRILERNAPAISMRPPGMMGTCLGGGAVPIVGEYPSFRVRTGLAYRLDEDTDLFSGDLVWVDYLNHSGPRFGWMGARLHLVEGLTLDEYRPREPWNSDPFAGGTGTYSPTGTFNKFTALCAVTNDDSDSVTWTTVGAEQYGWDVTGVGHIGYAFHDFSVAPFTGTLTASFSGTPTETSGATVFSAGSPVTVGAMIGETDGPSPPASNSTKQLGVPLNQDVPGGSVFIVVVATWDFDPLGSSASIGDEDVVDDNELRPLVLPGRHIINPVVELMPHFYGGVDRGVWWPVSFPYEGRTDHQHGRDVYLDAGNSFTVYDSTGAPIFRVDEDGDLHGKTGKALTFDL